MMKSIKGNLAAILSKVAAEKADCVEIGRGIDQKLDGPLGEKPSEKIQRVIRDELGDIMEGMCEENPLELAVWHEARAQKIRKGLKK